MSKRETQQVCRVIHWKLELHVRGFVNTPRSIFAFAFKIVTLPISSLSSHDFASSLHVIRVLHTRIQPSCHNPLAKFSS